jgi:hypothetical protein
MAYAEPLFFNCHGTLSNATFSQPIDQTWQMMIDPDSHDFRAKRG